MSFSHSNTDEHGGAHHSGGSDFGDDEASMIRMTYEVKIK